MTTITDKFYPPGEILEAVLDLQFDLSGSQWDRLGLYLEQIRETGRHTNLVSRADLDHLWGRHILDSLSLGPFLRQVASVADLGSGAGFPGIPLAVILPDTSFTLIESIGKKARFLETCRERLSLSNLRVIQGRAEDLGHDPAHRERYEAVTARAVGPLRLLLELALPLARPRGTFWAMKGERARQEIDEAGPALAELGAVVAAMHPSRTDQGKVSTGVIVEVRKTAGTPARYPRATAQMRKHPLQ